MPKTAKNQATFAKKRVAKAVKSKKSEKVEMAAKKGKEWQKSTEGTIIRKMRQKWAQISKN